MEERNIISDDDTWELKDDLIDPYFEKIILLKLGIASDYPYGSVLITTGEKLDNPAIQLSESYGKIGVRSSKPPKWKCVFPLDYSERSVVEAVENIRIGLEKILSNEGE